MASFTQDPNPTNDPSYLNISQGPLRSEVDKSKGLLFGAVGDILERAPKVVTSAITEMARKDIYSAVDKIRGEAGVDLATQEAAAGRSPTGARGDPSNFIFAEGDDPLGKKATPGASKGIPAGVSGLSDTLSTLKEGYDQGLYSKTYYDGRLEAAVRSIVAKYPGFRPEIDQMVHEITGIVPANALVADIRNDLDRAERAKNASATVFAQYVKQNEGYIKATLPDFWDRAAKGQPYSELQTHAAVSAFKAKELTNQAAQHELALGVAERKDVSEKAEIYATREANQYVDQALTAVDNASGGVAKIQEIMNQADGKPLTPQQQDAIRTQMSQLRYSISTELDRRLTNPFPGSTASYASAVRDPGKIKAIKDQALARVDAMEQQFLNKDTGAFHRDANYREAQSNADMRQVLDSSQWMRKMEILRKTLGDQAFSTLLMAGTKDGKSPMGTHLQALSDLEKTELVTGQIGSMTEQLQRRKAAGEKVPELKDPEGIRRSVQNAVSILTNPKTPIEGAEAAAKVMFGPGNLGFLGQFQPRNQMEIFTTLASPRVTAKMAELGKTNPELWQNYKTWAVEQGFMSQFKLAASEIGKTIRDPGAMVKVTWDDKSGAFIVTPVPGFEQAIRESRDRLNFNWLDIAKPLNQALDIIRPILKQDGEDVNQRIVQVLKEMGADPDAPKDPRWISTLAAAVKRRIGQFWEAYGSGTIGAPNPQIQVVPK